jgi:hypothetical protein
MIASGRWVFTARDAENKHAAMPELAIAILSFAEYFEDFH